MRAFPDCFAGSIGAGDLAELEHRAVPAWDSWKGLLVPGPYVAFAWVAEWPIFALDLSKDRIAEALDHARPLVGPERPPVLLEGG